MAAGKGKLLVTGFNFMDDNLKHPEVRALYKSLVDYAAGPSFKPEGHAEIDRFARTWRRRRPIRDWEVKAIGI